MVNNLKLIRINSGLTQKEVADRLNVSRTLVSKWESGTVRPTSEQIKELSGVFGMNEEDILKAIESVDIDPVTLNDHSAQLTDRLDELHLILTEEIKDVVNEQNAKLEEFNKTYEEERSGYEHRLNKICIIMIIIIIVFSILVYGTILISHYSNRNGSSGGETGSIRVIEITPYDGQQK